MGKFKIIFIIIFGGCLVLTEACSDAFAQDIHFSQFYMTPLTLNPALAGSLHDMEVQANYKTQWSSIGSPYKTEAASYDLSFQKKKRSKAYFAAGINFFSDKAGDSKMGTTQVNLTAAGHVYFNKYSKLGAGIQIGFDQRSVNYSALQWGNQFDGTSYNPALSSRENQTSNSYTFVDASAGVVWAYNNTSGGRRVADNRDFSANFGASIFHISQPQYSFIGNTEKLDVKFVLHGNTVISVPYSKIAFVPGFMFTKQGPASEIYAGSLIRYKLVQSSRYTGLVGGSAISMGAFFRAKDAAVIALLMEYSEYTIGMSYDVNTSSLNVASAGRGGFEISLRYLIASPFIVQSRSRF